MYSARSSFPRIGDERASHGLAVDDDLALGTLRGREGEVLEEGFEDGVEAARADVLGAAVRLDRVLGDRSTASRVNSSLMPSVASSALYCFVSAFFGS